MPMPGTDQLQTADAGRQLAVLIDRSSSTERTIEKFGVKLDETIERQSVNFNDLKQALIEVSERQTARSEANAAAIESANKLIDHVRLRTIDQDTQQVLMIRQEETARQNQDDKLRGEMAAQNQKHTDEMKALGVTIKSLSDSISDLKSSMRVVTVISSFLSLIASGVIVGALLHIIP